jgi:hypothetical protein
MVDWEPTSWRRKRIGVAQTGRHGIFLINDERESTGKHGASSKSSDAWDDRTKNVRLAAHPGTDLIVLPIAVLVRWTFKGHGVGAAE